MRKMRSRKQGGDYDQGGRVEALVVLDRLMASRKSRKALRVALEAELAANPLWFFRMVIMPLLPKDAKLSFEREIVIGWKSLAQESPPQGEQGKEVRQ